MVELVWGLLRVLRLVRPAGKYGRVLLEYPACIELSQEYILGTIYYPTLFDSLSSMSHNHNLDVCD